jgi:predicted transport protein
MNYIKPERIFLKDHPKFNEKWVQDMIAEDPSLLSLGELILKDKERVQPGAGRLDLLFQDAENPIRYEVEIQLGKTDESHIIRTIEYWDIERKRYPQYDHVAVLIAEDITSRFLNVVSLFNGFIPIIAYQLQAYKFGDNISLVLAKVLDLTRIGLVEEDESKFEAADRSYWEKRSSKSIMELTDKLVEKVLSMDPKLSLKYNKFYLGLTYEGRANNFIAFKPKKEWVWVEIGLDKSEEIDKKLDELGYDAMQYDIRKGRYWIRVTNHDSEEQLNYLYELFRTAYKEAIEK